MTYVATLTRTGQITVPKNVREWLGVESGQRIVFKRRNNEVVIAREKTAMEIAEDIDKLIPDDVRAEHLKKYAGMSSEEMRQKWLKNGGAEQYFQDEMERTT